MTTLYVLTDAGNPEPATLDRFCAWEDAIPENERTALGKRLRINHVAGVTIVTAFVATGLGWHNRKPQVFMTLATGEGVWQERRYTSLRAALNGHRDEVALHRKSIPSVFDMLTQADGDAPVDD